MSWCRGLAGAARGNRILIATTGIGGGLAVYCAARALLQHSDDSGCGCTVCRQGHGAAGRRVPYLCESSARPPGDSLRECSSSSSSAEPLLPPAAGDAQSATVGQQTPDCPTERDPRAQLSADWLSPEYSEACAFTASPYRRLYGHAGFITSLYAGFWFRIAASTGCWQKTPAEERHLPAGGDLISVLLSRQLRPGSDDFRQRRQPNPEVGSSSPMSEKEGATEAAKLRDGRYNELETMLSEVKRDMVNINSKLQFPQHPAELLSPISPTQDECREFKDESISDADSLDGECVDGEFSFYSPLKASQSRATTAKMQQPLWAQPRQPPDGAASIDDLMNSVKSDFQTLAQILDNEEGSDVGDVSRPDSLVDPAGESYENFPASRLRAAGRSSDDSDLERLRNSPSNFSITISASAMSTSEHLDASSNAEFEEDTPAVPMRKGRHPSDRSQSDPSGATIDRDSLDFDSARSSQNDAADYTGFWIPSSTYLAGGTSSFKGNASSDDDDYTEFSDRTRDLLLRLKAKNQPSQPVAVLAAKNQPEASEPPAVGASTSEETDAPPGSPAESSEDDENDISDFIINTYEKDASYDQPSFEYQSIHDILRASSHMIGSSRCLFPILEESSDEISSSEEEDSDEEEDCIDDAQLEEKYVSPMDTEEEEVALRHPEPTVHIEMKEMRKSDTTDASDADVSRLSGLKSESASTFYTAHESCDRDSLATVTDGRASRAESGRDSQLLESGTESEGEAPADRTDGADSDSRAGARPPASDKAPPAWQLAEQFGPRATAAASDDSHAGAEGFASQPRGADEIEYSSSDEAEDSSSSSTSSSSSSSGSSGSSSSRDCSSVSRRQRLPVLSADDLDAARWRLSLKRLSGDDMRRWRRQLRRAKLPRLAAIREASAERSGSSSEEHDETEEQEFDVRQLLRPTPANAEMRRFASDSDIRGATPRRPLELKPSAQLRRREEPQALERVSRDFAPLMPKGGQVQAIASSRARVTDSRGGQVSLGTSETSVTTEASGASASVAIARATARAASIASAALSRDRDRDPNEYRIFISTSCTIKPSNTGSVIDPRKLHITVNSEQESADNEGERRQVISSPRRFDQKDDPENVFSLLRLGRQSSRHETVTQELPSPAGGDKQDYQEFEDVTKSIIQSQFNTERREELTTEYSKRAAKTVKDEVQKMEEFKKLKSSGHDRAADALGRSKPDHDRFLELKRQLDVLKSRQHARQKQEELQSGRKSSFRSRTPPLTPGEPEVFEFVADGDADDQVDSAMVDSNMVESAYISDSDPSSPESAEKASPEAESPPAKADDTKRPQYQSVLQQSIEHPSAKVRREHTSLLNDQLRIQRAKDEYHNRPVVSEARTLTHRGKYARTSSPSRHCSQSASSTLSKSSSKSMHQLRELLDDESARKTFSKFTSSNRRYKSTDLDNMDDAAAANAIPSTTSSVYDLNAFTTEPGAYKSISLYDLRRSILTDMQAGSKVGQLDDSKSYVSLIETDIDTGEELSQPILETDVDGAYDEEEELPVRTQSMVNLASPKCKRSDGLITYEFSDEELDGSLNRAASEDLLDGNGGPKRSSVKRTSSKKRQPLEKSFIERLEERATSQGERDICKSLSRLSIPKWLDNLPLDYDAHRAEKQEPRPSWSKTWHSRTSGRHSESHDDSEQSLKPLIIPKFVSLPTRSSLLSPGYSSVGTPMSEGDDDRASMEPYRSRSASEDAEQEKPKKYFTGSTWRSECAAQAKPKGTRGASGMQRVERPTLSPVKLAPSDFIPRASRAEVGTRPEILAEQRMQRSVAGNADTAPTKTESRSVASEDDEIGDFSSQEASDITVVALNQLRSPVDDEMEDDCGSGSETSDSSSGSSTTDSSDSSTDSETSESSDEEDSPAETRISESKSQGPAEDNSEEETVVETSVVYTKIAPGSNAQILTAAWNSLSVARMSERVTEVQKPGEPTSIDGIVSIQSESHISSYEEGWSRVSETQELLNYVDNQLNTFSFSRVRRHTTTNRRRVELTEAVEQARRHFLLDEALEHSEEYSTLLSTTGRRSPTVTFDEVLLALSSAASTIPRSNSQDSNSSSNSSDSSSNSTGSSLNSWSRRRGKGSPVVTEANQGVIREGQRYMIECVNPRCARRAELLEAKRAYRSCHHCFTYYCSVECRRAHWDAHRRVCVFSRLSSSCKKAMAAALANGETRRQLSSLARSGFACLGRGCVLLAFASQEAADSFCADGLSGLLRPPIFVPTNDVNSADAFASDDLLAACREYDTETEFAIQVAIGVGREFASEAAPAVAVGPLVRKWCIASLSNDASESELHDRRRDDGEAKRRRQALFDRTLRLMRQRGVSLRHHYPAVFAVLADFVENGTDFPEQTIYPVDSNNGGVFRCRLSPGAEPIIDGCVGDLQPQRRLISTDL